MHRILPLFVLLVAILSCHRQEKGFEQIYAPFLQTQTGWADSMLLEMTLAEKIGQLLVLQSSERIPTDTLADWVWNGQLGGWMPEGISLSDYTQLTDTLQTITRIPLMMGTRQIVALNNQFTDVPHYPLPATISAITPSENQTALLEQYVIQCKALKIHFSLTPALHKADTIHNRFNFFALENDPEAQFFWSFKVMQRLQEENLLSIGNSFKEIAFAEESDVVAVRNRDSLMHQYFNLSQNGLSGLLIDNAVFRADTNRFYPANFLTEYLQKNASFDGLAFGIPDSTTTAFELLHGGIDMLVVTDEPWRYVSELKQSITNGFLTIEQLNRKVRKVLLAKTWLGLNVKPSRINNQYVEELMDKTYHIYPIYELYEKSLTLASTLR